MQLFCLNFAGVVAKCSGSAKTYVIVQGAFNLFELIIFTTLSCALIHVKDNKSILTNIIYICNWISVCFLILWPFTGFFLVAVALFDWLDDHSKCNDALIISAIIYLLLHHLLMWQLVCRSLHAGCKRKGTENWLPYYRHLVCI